MSEDVADSALDLIGSTPLVRLSKLRPPGGADLLAKLELQNPGGSIKDRASLAMIDQAEREGLLKPGSVIIEASSGNTGISLAMIAAVRGYRCIVVMPEDMSASRRHLLKAYGAEVVLTPAVHGMAAAVAHAEKMSLEEPNSFVPRQFSNEANPWAHRTHTAREIWDACDGRINVFVAGVGTGGTLSGVGEFLKGKRQDIRIVGVEPKASAVLSGGKPGLHGIQGIGAGFVPDILKREFIDEIVTVSDLDAERMARKLSRVEGLFVGPSSGANVHVARIIAAELGEDRRIVTVLCDTGERYLC